MLCATRAGVRGQGGPHGPLQRRPRRDRAPRILHDILGVEHHHTHSLSPVTRTRTRSSLFGVDVTYEGTKRELTTDKGVLRYHEAGDPDARRYCSCTARPGVTGWRNYRGNRLLRPNPPLLHPGVPGFGVSAPWDGIPVLTAGSSVTRFMDALDIESAR